MPALAIREYTPARLHSLTPYLATSDPARAIEWYVGGVRRGAPRRPDRHARRPHRARGDARRRHRVHARGRVPRGGPPEPGDARRQHGRADAPRPRLRRDVRAGRRHGRDRAAADRGVRTARAAERSAIRSVTAGSCRPRSKPTTSPSRTSSAGATATSATSRCWSPTVSARRASSAACSTGSSRPATSPARSTSRRSRRRPGIDTPARQTPRSRLYFRVDDIEAAAARVRDLGGAGAVGRRLRLGRQRRVRRRPGSALRPLPAQARLLRPSAVRSGIRRSAPDAPRGGRVHPDERARPG